MRDMSFRGPEHAASQMQTTSGKVDAERFLTEEDQGECTILRRDITSENGIFVTPCMCAFVEDKGTIDHMKGNGKCLRCMQWIAEICVGVRVRPDFMVVSRNGRPVRRSDTYSRPPKSRSFRTLWTSNAGMLVEVWIEDEFRTSINNYLLGSFHVFPTPLQSDLDELLKSSGLPMRATLDTVRGLLDKHPNDPAADALREYITIPGLCPWIKAPKVRPDVWVAPWPFADIMALVSVKTQHSMLPIIGFDSVAEAWFDFMVRLYGISPPADNAETHKAALNITTRSLSWVLLRVHNASDLFMGVMEGRLRGIEASLTKAVDERIVSRTDTDYSHWLSQPSMDAVKELLIASRLNAAKTVLERKFPELDSLLRILKLKQQHIQFDVGVWDYRTRSIVAE